MFGNLVLILDSRVGLVIYLIVFSVDLPYETTSLREIY